ncbi:hypothetical protein HU675_0038555 [Bradyrhizobium septentrionale]|uniref:hypothetical protein n=1 Tax=Bradyrhizobium septentrionale TaxID=1404411 RepID=UPI001596C623|nr:hypothetical protein [Bradyrhizobium septentrionale]UGY23788.1 hypothetical protein HU675_0038555 [Bradyrhizobium septentrionale]
MIRNTPTFRFKCAYMGCVEYEVCDESGHYLVEIRERSPDAYALSIANGDGVRSEWKSSVGILRRASGWSKGENGRYSFEVAPDTVDAFNEWRMEEHLAAIAKIEAQPERYGVLTADDPIRRPPPLARGGDYRFGEYVWDVTHALA